MDGWSKSEGPWLDETRVEQHSSALVIGDGSVRCDVRGWNLRGTG